MIAIIIFNLLLTLILCSCVTIFYIEYKKKKIIINNLENKISTIYNTIEEVKNDIDDLKKNPINITNKCNLLNDKINKLSKVIETFNNGFSPQQTYLY